MMCVMALSAIRWRRRRDGLASTVNTVTYGYDAASQLTAVADGASSEQYGYDQLGRVTAIYNTGSPNAPVLSRSNFYDNAGSRSYSAAYLGGTNQLYLNTYEYDALGRMTSVTHTNVPSGVTIPNLSYAYDETGNRVTNDGTFSYLYDDDGNLTRKTTVTTGEYTVYSYDHRNCLTAAQSYTSGNTLTESLAIEYDLLDHRIITDVDENGDGKTDRGEAYVYDNPGKVESNGHATDDILAVYTKTYNPTTGVYTGMFLSTRNLHGPGVDEILAEETVNSGGTSVETRWTLADNLGTIRDRVTLDDTTGAAVHNTHVIFDASGNITAEFDHVAMAWLTSSSTQSLKNVNGPTYGYTGREYDADLGLTYYRARWYDSATGRFVSEDPIFADTSNTYRYVGNNATNARDPSGLDHSLAEGLESALRGEHGPAYQEIAERTREVQLAIEIQRDVRREQLERLRNATISPLPGSVPRFSSAIEAQQFYQNLAGRQLGLTSEDMERIENENLRSSEKGFISIDLEERKVVMCRIFSFYATLNDLNSHKYIWPAQAAVSGIPIKEQYGYAAFADYRAPAASLAEGNYAIWRNIGLGVLGTPLRRN